MLLDTVLTFKILAPVRLTLAMLVATVLTFAISVAVVLTFVISVATVLTLPICVPTKPTVLVVCRFVATSLIGELTSFNSECYADIFINITPIGLSYSNMNSISFSTINPATGTSFLSYAGINNGILSINSITLGHPTTLIKNGSSIKIYRND